MRSGPIQPEDKQEWIDQREKELSLWEQGKKGTQIDLPWTELSSPDSLNEVQSLVANARSVILAIGATTTSRKLIDAVLQYLPAQCRLYVYGASDLETELVQKIAGMGDHVLARLGHRPPADWLIVDKGSDGRLVVGPTVEHRKWVLPVSGDLARSLFEAFCVLFWFHATSEALPDDNGNVAFRPPLAAPFKDPGPDIPLPAGRLLLDGAPDDPVSDAEFRISPNASDPGHARVLFIPPTDGLASGGTGRPVDLELPKALCRRGHRVLWVDTGLPRTTVTRQRMVMNLVEAPIALQIEWPAATAIDFRHRFERAAKQPAWEFHPARRLDAIKGEVLLNGATQPAKIAPSVSLDAGDVDAPLLDFDSARPARLPDVPPLALEAAIKWRLVPATLPRGARRAEIVRHWTAVDEWTSRTVESLRDALDELENQEGLLSKLRQWLPSRDGNSALEREKLREKLRDELDEIGESPPSQIAAQAEDRMTRLAAVTNRLDGLRRTTHDQQQDAEDAKAEDAQRDIWKKRVEDAKTKLEEIQQKLAENEIAQGEAAEKLQKAQAALDNVVAVKRRERKAFLEKKRVELEAELEKAHQGQKSLKAGSKSRSSKSAQKKANRRVQDVERELASNKRDRESIADWSPPASEISAASTRLNEAKKVDSNLRSQATSLAEESKRFDLAVSEEFRFKKPPRLETPSTSEVGSHPPIPSEAPPEIGELYEHGEKRFLAIRTWEQLRPAQSVASRLRAEPVVATNPSKV